MATVQTDTWYRVLEKLRQRIGSQRFELWFKHTEMVSVDHEVIEIGAPNHFVAEWLQTHFAPTVAEILKGESGDSLRVKFRVSPQLYQQACQKQLAESASLVTEASSKASGLNPPPQPRSDYQMDNFVVGPGSRLAYACVQEVATHFQSRYNPLFLHSECGLGKTHLLHGIWNSIRERSDGAAVEYISSEVFTNEFIYAMTNGRLDGFRDKYRRADVLLIDDVNFFSGKNKLQEELLHTFDALHQQGRQIVLACDTHPKKLTAFRNNLINRFVSGMVVCIDTPDAATRLKILELKAERLRSKVPGEVLQFVAKESRGSVRDLEGALNIVVAYSGLCNRPADIPMAREALRHTISSGEKKTAGITNIEKVVAEQFATTSATLRSGKRTRTVTVPRQVCMYFARRLTHLSCADIANHFGQKHHTSVLFADKSIQKRIETDAEFKALLAQIEESIGR